VKTTHNADYVISQRENIRLIREREEDFKPSWRGKQIT
jgi:hypothetical protein